MGGRYWTNTGAVYKVQYHIVWCPKYRRKVLVDGIDKELKFHLLEKAQEIGVTIETMEVMPDHVHLFVSASPTLAPCHIVYQLKGYTSRILRQKNATLRSRLPTLWTRSYFLSTIGDISEDQVKKYIDNQKNV